MNYDPFKEQAQKWMDEIAMKREEFNKAHDIQEEELPEGSTERKDYCPSCKQPYYLTCRTYEVNGERKWKTKWGLCEPCLMDFMVKKEDSNVSKDTWKRVSNSSRTIVPVPQRPF